MRLASTFNRTNVIKSDRPISVETLRQHVPSIFAEAKHDSRSKRYSYVPTSAVLDGLMSEGFHPFFACQAKVRTENLDKKDFTKHMIRFRHANSFANNGEANEIILVNSHDGSTSYQMMAGTFRFVCQNGLICGDLVDEIRVRHSGNIVGQIIEGAYDLVGEFERIDESKENMKLVNLSRGEQLALATAAMQLKYDDKQPVDPSAILQPHRIEDRGSDLWTTFNVLQENLVKGGQAGRNANNRRTRTRGVNNILANVQLNKGLWTLAEKMRELKAA